MSGDMSCAVQHKVLITSRATTRRWYWCAFVLYVRDSQPVCREQSV